MQTAIRPTTTQRVRDFLIAQGAAPAPWARLDETYAALYRLLRARAADDAFWRPLAGLLRDVVTDAADGPRRLPARQAELLRSWDVDSLVRDLRRALPGRCAPRGDHLGFARALGAPVLGGFLVLGLAAAGCDLAPGEGEAPAWAEGCALDAGSEVYAAIEDNGTLSTDEKAGLCGCFAALQGDWRESLGAVFASCDPEAIAYALEDLAARCESEGGALAADPTADAESFCSEAPAYKGVSFPA